ncbi:hypothetical protein BKA56DRAFT_213893 [Ilyonectria sp. MPI-CAGE-AT-0026]|nr:hypothetical protein BKA56DRAFT_213893 [Ilyonectria sp. MPI-CAGE-AT-0026]
MCKTGGDACWGLFCGPCVLVFSVSVMPGPGRPAWPPCLETSSIVPPSGGLVSVVVPLYAALAWLRSRQVTDPNRELRQVAMRHAAVVTPVLRATDSTSSRRRDPWNVGGMYAP